MSVTLYELGGLDGRRYSQFSWRTRLALAHKGIPFDTVAVRVSDKGAIAFSGQDKVPILRDGDAVITDSWRIAEHLEDTHADRPSLFGCGTGRGLARFVNVLVDRTLIPKLVPLLMIDVLTIVDAEDAAHLRRQIEAAFRSDLEALAANRNRDIVGFRRQLDPMRVTLRSQPFLSGATPAYADYALFSLLQWARIVSPYEVLEDSDAIAIWRDRMLDLFDGLGRTQAPRASQIPKPELTG